MRAYRKPLGGLAVALFVALVPANLSAKEILFINPGFADRGFWHAVSSTMTAAAAQFGYDLTIVSADRKWPVMVSKGLDAIKAGSPDYLIIVNEHQQAPVLLEIAQRKGIPTLLLLNDLTQEQQKKYGKPREKFSKWIGSITPDNRLAGYEMAKAVLSPSRTSSAEPLRLLSLAGDFKTPASLDRLEGLDQVLAEYGPRVKELRRFTVNWSEAEAYERTSLLLESERPDAIWAANDPIAFGAMRAIRERGLIPGRDVRFAGLNWSPQAIDAVIGGEMELTHGGHFLAGAWSIVLIADYDRGRDFADIGTHIRFPMSAMTGERAQQYKAALGDENWSKIDFRRFRRQEDASIVAYDFTLSRLLMSIRP